MSVTAAVCCPPNRNKNVTREQIDENKTDLAISMLVQMGEMLTKHCFIAESPNQVKAIKNRVVSEGIRLGNGAICWEVFDLDPICVQVEIAANSLKKLSSDDLRLIDDYMQKIDKILRESSFNQECIKFHVSKLALLAAEEEVQKKKELNLRNSKLVQSTILFFISQDKKQNSEFYKEKGACVIQ